jgi:hypothetical protein
MYGVKEEEQSKSATPKLEYNSPALVNYGKLRELTTGGSGRPEGNATMNANKSRA